MDAIELETNYPHGLRSDEIEAKVRECCRAIVDSDGDINTVLQQTPVILMGQNELQGRWNKDAVSISIIVAIISFIVSLIALGIAYNAESSKAEFEQKQIKLLEEIRDGVANR